MQGINCVKGEIHNVLTVLRLNPPRDTPTSSDSSSLSSSSSSSDAGSQSSSYSHYYSSDSRYGAEDNSLIRQLKDLYELLSQHASLQSLDTSAFLSPFLAVISSHTTDIFTTAAALHSLHKFLLYDLILSSSPSVSRALCAVVDAVTHCNFDARDREDAEVVSMKIIEILMECLRCDAGWRLSEQAVVDMVDHCLRVRGRRTASKLLRRYAENVLMQMVLVLFARISDEAGGGRRRMKETRLSRPARDSAGNRGSLSAEAGSSERRQRGALLSPQQEEDVSRLRATSATPDSNGYESSPSADPALPNSASSPHLASSSTFSSSSLAPYGIPALERVFLMLVDLINPATGGQEQQQQEKEADRVLGLRLIRTVLETAVSHSTTAHAPLSTIAGGS
jgi:hypothetical protein